MDSETQIIIAKSTATLIAEFLKPALERLGSKIGTQLEVGYQYFAGKYEKYLTNAVERYSYFNSVVFKNEQRKLFDYYVPLTIIKTKTAHEICIDNFPEDEVKEIRKMLIVDTAGMGKTTLLKYLFLTSVEKDAGVPIFLELRRLQPDLSIVDFILEQISGVNKKVDPDVFFKLLSSGEFIFFLDGYDEIPESDRSQVTSLIQDFIAKAPRNIFIMTSREESGLTAFSQFQRYTIKPLQKDEAYALLTKYGSGSSLSIKLIGKLELPENKSIHEFLANPLLTSLLFKSFEYKHTIPLKRHIFYRQVYESLYETHDLTKEGGEFQRAKKCNLDIDRFEQLLRAFGAITYKEGKTEFNKVEALEYIKKAKLLSSEDQPSESYVLHDLTHAVPLIVEDGNYYRWSHRSIQEYFAALYICKNSKGKEVKNLLRYYDDKDFEQHMNLILLCADIDRALFDRAIAKKLAEQLLAEYSGLYHGNYNNVSSQLIKERKSLICGKALFLIKNNHPYDILSNRNNSGMERHNRNRDVHRRMMQQITEEGINSSSTNSSSDPMIGQVFNKVTKFVSQAQPRVNLPFIITNKRHSNTPYNIQIDGLTDLNKIDDTPSSPANSALNFESVNNILNNVIQWKFDPNEAEQFLGRLKEEDIAQIEFEL